MTPEEHSALAGEARTQYENDTRKLDDTIRRTEERLWRLKAKRAEIQETYFRRVSALTAAFLGMEAHSAPLPPAELDGAERSRKKRGSLDAPLFDLFKEIAQPECTVAGLTETWNHRHPEEHLTESTVRGVLKRLTDAGSVIISYNGGGKGSNDPRRFSLRTDSVRA